MPGEINVKTERSVNHTRIRGNEIVVGGDLKKFANLIIMITSLIATCKFCLGLFLLSSLKLLGLNDKHRIGRELEFYEVFRSLFRPDIYSKARAWR